MQDLFELTPELLLEQGQQMSNLYAAYENLFAGVAGDLEAINGGWSDFLANNFSGKIASAQKTFSGALTMLRNSADSVKTVAEASQEMDTAWASRISGMLFAAMNQNAGNSADVPNHPAYEKADIGNYTEKLSAAGEAGHAEYAKLCQLFQEADREGTEHGFSDKVVESIFKLKLQEALPENDPLRNISVQQMEVTRSASGFSAVTIRDNENAIVIFAGTNFDLEHLNDEYADAQILLGVEGAQEKEAKALIDSLSKECTNIKVTGHSLGGYLATAATLDNDAVSECVAFDPPGRKDRDVQMIFNNKQFSKITTYKAVLSPVSSYVAGNRGIGKVKPLFVSAKDNIAFHMIEHICDSLGGEGEIRKNWE